MVTEKMTVHKALAELKVIGNRIDKEIQNSDFCIANKHSNTVINGASVEQFNKNAEASYQSVIDLIKRRNALKSSVVLSNANTKVTIGNVEYTVAEAIDMKTNGFQYYLNLLDRIADQYKDAEYNCNSANGDVLDIRVEEHLKVLYGNFDGKKDLSGDMRKSRDEFIKNQTMEILDPIKAKEKMAEIEEKINSFMVDVDAALSVSNAITEIEISY